jgi:5,10-methylene-tetrahydrofolate dehydrogenase/methenyl tetrahydrofolate cyclohydrolase
MYAIISVFTRRIMPVVIADGAKVAEIIIADLKKWGPPNKSLWVFLVEGMGGETEERQKIFLKQKKKLAERLGIDLRICRFFADTVAPERFKAVISETAALDSVGGIIIEKPLPDAIAAMAPPNKDIERKRSCPAFLAVEEILKFYSRSFRKKQVVIFGKGRTIGQAIFEELQARRHSLEWAGLTMVSKRDWQKSGVGRTEIKSADILICGTDQQNLIYSADIKPGATVIDFANNCHFESCKKIAGLITPSRNGVGPVLIACLFLNFYITARLSVSY